jgi:hypothetical protein
MIVSLVNRTLEIQLHLLKVLPQPLPNLRVKYQVVQLDRGLVSLFPRLHRLHLPYCHHVILTCHHLYLHILLPSKPGYQWPMVSSQNCPFLPICLRISQSTDCWNFYLTPPLHLCYRDLTILPSNWLVTYNKIINQALHFHWLTVLYRLFLQEARLTVPLLKALKLTFVPTLRVYHRLDRHSNVGIRRVFLRSVMVFPSTFPSFLVREEPISPRCL